ncbi:MAG TPA: methyltransferase domain-containing protein [bacterium]|nr:methyltransferase domain-containing protein [bacterium]
MTGPGGGKPGERGDASADARRLNEARFTATARSYASSRVTVRREENDALLRLAAPARADRVLDVACGPGTLLLEFAPFVRHAVGVDLTAAMLEQAGKRVRDASSTGPTGRVSLVRGAGERLPFPDGVFSLAVNAYALHHFGEPRRVLHEITRVVRAGGRVIISDLVGSENVQARALQNEIEHLRDPSHMGVESARGIAALLEGQGLTVIGGAEGSQHRELGEWLRLAHTPPDRAALVRARILESLPGDRAGMTVSVDGEIVRFMHRWAIVAARKP